MAVLAIFSPAIALAQAGAPDCHATPKETHKELPWAGNAGEIQWSADQLDCKVDTGGLPWITVSVMPPVSGGAGMRVLRYSVDTNFASSKREGKIEVGDATVTLEQAGGPAPGMAFSPSRLDFTIASGTGSPELTKTLYVGSEEPLLFAAIPAAAAPWLKVKDSSDVKTPQKRRSYLVTVTAEGKAPGVYQSTIELDAPGASNAKEVVPVTMTVEKAK
ncbi:MAG TPA: hypothetical protein VMA31_15545 [Bryobacteraceae bacterium]|nr:hypothetical protein [Bryobacteraceae bacterium]